MCLLLQIASRASLLFQRNQLSSMATTSFHAVEGNGHGSLFTCKVSTLQMQEEKNQYCVWERKRKVELAFNNKT